jgi:hypothetical protein
MDSGEEGSGGDNFEYISSHPHCIPRLAKKRNPTFALPQAVVQDERSAFNAAGRIEDAGLYIIDVCE